MTVEEFKVLQDKATEELKMPDKMSEIIDKNNLLPTYISEWQKLYANQTYIVKDLEIKARSGLCILSKHSLDTDVRILR